MGTSIDNLRLKLGEPELELLLSKVDPDTQVDESDAKFIGEDADWSCAHCDPTAMSYPFEPGEVELSATGPCSLDRSKKSNWVEDAGGLPNYICNIAKSIHEKQGKSISNAIQIAVGSVKRWAKGAGDVDAKTRARAAKAVAEWEAKKAKAHATPNK